MFNAEAKSLRVFQGHTSEVNAVATLPGGQRALSASSDWTLRLWDLSTGETQRIFEFEDHKTIDCLVVLPDGQRALSGSDDILRLWDLETGESLRLFEGHTDRVRTVGVLPDGRRALSGSNDKTLRVWHLETGSGAIWFVDDHAITCSTVGANSTVVIGNARGRVMSFEALTQSIDELHNQNAPPVKLDAGQGDWSKLM